MRPPIEIASDFSVIDVHDDTIEAINVVPAIGRTSCKVSIRLYRHWENKRRLLQFIGCTNISFTVDTAVLLGNAPNNTCCLEATASVEDVMKAMRIQKKAWNVSYSKGIDLLPVKLASASKYTLFRVRLFGGTLEIIAKSFKFGKISSKMAT